MEIKETIVEFEGKIEVKNKEMEDEFIEVAKESANFFQVKVNEYFCEDGYLVIRVAGKEKGVEIFKKFLDILWKFINKKIEFCEK